MGPVPMWGKHPSSDASKRYEPFIAGALDEVLSAMVCTQDMLIHDVGCTIAAGVAPR
jgi:hypothetical protein